jgi:hypothetical protein
MGYPPFIRPLVGVNEDEDPAKTNIIEQPYHIFSFEEIKVPGGND